MNDTAAETGRASFRLKLALAILVLMAVAGTAWWWPPGSRFGLDATVEETVDLIRSWGAWGVAGSIGLMVAHSFLPFPAEIVALANGMVFGPIEGALVTWVGAMLGACAAFGVVRFFGRPFALRMLPVQQQQRLAAWSRERGGVALLIARLIPLIAFNLINYAAALTEISWWTFLWATGLGILPLTVLLALLGDSMLTVPLWLWLSLGAAAMLGWLLADRHRRSKLRKPGRPLHRMRPHDD